VTTATAAPRIERLSALSARKVIDPDVEITGSIGDGQVVADELLSVRDLGLDLTVEQRRRLAAEEIAAITEEGIRFESILTAGFSVEIQRAERVTDPWVTYALHEIGEESRHSRLFVRLLGQLAPTATNPFNRGVLGFIKRRVLGFVITRPPIFYTLVLAGEEIPDLIQKRSAEHPDTDPFLVAVNRYHRMEEARHLSFARARLPELFAAAPRRQRFQARAFGPYIIQSQLEGLLHPGIYQSVGLPGWRTWLRVHKSPHVVQFRHEATRPILRELMASGAFRSKRVPRAWRRLCGVDRTGQPVTESGS
jgi:para-aminobenzoate N-oxygenase AurF